MHMVLELFIPHHYESENFKSIFQFLFAVNPSNEYDPSRQRIYNDHPELMISMIGTMDSLEVNIACLQNVC